MSKRGPSKHTETVQSEEVGRDEGSKKGVRRAPTIDRTVNTRTDHDETKEEEDENDDDDHEEGKNAPGRSKPTHIRHYLILEEFSKLKMRKSDEDKLGDRKAVFEHYSGVVNERFEKLDSNERKTLEERDKDGSSFLHLIIRESKVRDFDKIFQHLFRRVMELNSKLCLRYDKVSSVLQTAVELKTPIKRRHLVTYFVSKYPNWANQIIKEDGEQSTLLHDIIPILDKTSEIDFRRLTGDPGKVIIPTHIDSHACCCSKCPLKKPTSPSGINSHSAATTGLSKDGKKVPPIKDQDGNTVLHIAVVAEQDNEELQLEKVRQVYEWCPEAIKEVNTKGESAYQLRLRSLQSKHRDSLYKDDKILFFLKDKIFHEVERDQIVDLLRTADGQDPELYLDLRESQNATVKISETNLREFLSGLRFENILQYVQIPRHPFVADPRTKTSTEVPSKATEDLTSGAGREDFRFIFAQLAEKGVKKILELIVDDDEARPHTDEVISELGQIEVENWDWNKLDISSGVLQKAAKDAKRIRLWSSGSHSVLRDWSGCDGLNLLPQLERVTVVIRWHVESERQIKLYKDDFIGRMKEHCPNVAVDVHLERATSRPVQYWLSRTTQPTTNVWLEKLQPFLDFMTQLTPDQKPKEKIRVAVLDDGVDLMQLGHMRFPGISYYTETQKSFTRTNPHYFSSTGHGTLMASLVLQVCPWAELYIARLHQARSEAGVLQPTAKSAAKAIRWATRCKVHIISMSWTIPGNEVQEELELAIAAAEKDKILMLGSASDQGLNSNFVSYPGRAISEGKKPVICIGAAHNIYGTPNEAARKEAEFYFPGSAVLPQANFNEVPKPLSGSSVATALAAGLTALILFCVNLSPTFSKNVEDGYSYRDNLQNQGLIRRIFKSMAEGAGGGYVSVEGFPTQFPSPIWDEESQKLFDDKLEYIIRPCIDHQKGRLKNVPGFK